MSRGGALSTQAKGKEALIRSSHLVVAVAVAVASHLHPSLHTICPLLLSVYPYLFSLALSIPLFHLLLSKAKKRVLGQRLFTDLIS